MGRLVQYSLVWGVPALLSQRPDDMPVKSVQSFPISNWLLYKSVRELSKKSKLEACVYVRSPVYMGFLLSDIPLHIYGWLLFPNPFFVAYSYLVVLWK